jgi:hypothetical protein
VSRIEAADVPKAVAAMKRVAGEWLEELEELDSEGGLFQISADEGNQVA